MTRDEILYIANRRGKSCLDLIYEVYKELESRTCDSCKYSMYHEEQDILECFKLNNFCWRCDDDVPINEVTGDFGCNKWESKDEPTK